MRSRFRLKILLASTGLAASLGAACSSTSTATEPSGGPDGGGGGGDSIWTKFGITDPKPPTVKFEDVKSPYPEDAASCKAFTESAYPDAHSCGCDNCLALQRQCDALEGCKEVTECYIGIKCTEVYSCYLAPTDTKCVPIVDKWGNTGLATAISLKLTDCAVAAKCR